MPQGSEYVDFLTGQRQTREFTPELVSDADVQTLLEAMRWTGSSSNSQPWQFLVLRDPATIAELSKSAVHTNWITRAPLVFVVLTEGSDRYAHAYDLGRVDERILLAAQALGLGAGIITFGTDSAQKLAHETLQVPEDWSIYSAVAVGHPAETAKPKKLGGRKPLSELVHWDRFGQR
jgi:nitroreductase